MESVAARLSHSLHQRYGITRELGRGGMATVYLAHDVRHDRAVALNRDEALSWLERAYAERADLMAYLNVDPRLDGLRHEPRFAALARKLAAGPRPAQASTRTLNPP